MMRTRLMGSALASVAVATIVASAVAHASAGPRPTLAQLRADVAAAVKVARPPDLGRTIPPLASMDHFYATLGTFTSPCYSQFITAVPTNATTSCSFGDRAAQRTMLLVGDSQAAMWLPAFDAIGKSLHWKVVAIARMNCPPWPDQDPVDYRGANQSGCVSLVNSELALGRSLHPAVVVPLGLGFHVGKGKTPTVAHEVTAMRDFVAQMGARKTLFLSPIPMYRPYFTRYTPGYCLATAKDIRGCEYSPKTMTDQVHVAAAREVAAQLHQTYVDVAPLICTTAKCALFVSDHGNRLVYMDAEHLNRLYTTWISGALGQLLAPVL